MELNKYLKQKRKEAFQNKKVGDLCYYVNNKIKNNPIEKYIKIIDIANNWIICELYPNRRTYFDIETGAERLQDSKDYVTGILWPSKEYMDNIYKYLDDIYELKILVNHSYIDEKVLEKLLTVLKNPDNSKVILKINGTEEERKKERQARKNKSRKKHYYLRFTTNENRIIYLDNCEINQDLLLTFKNLREDSKKFDFKEAIYIRQCLKKRNKELVNICKIYFPETNNVFIDLIDNNGVIYDSNKNKNKIN